MTRLLKLMYIDNNINNKIVEFEYQNMQRLKGLSRELKFDK